MEIKFDYYNEYYNIKDRLLNRCITIIDNNMTYHFLFIVNGNKAIVKTDSNIYLEEAVNYFHNKNLAINEYKFENGDYINFDYVYTFKLPISIIQPSKFFIDKDYLAKLDEHILDDEDISFQVDIINDEYVLLNNHTILYLMLEHDIKMVNVYIKKADYYVSDFVYIAKEGNIKKIKDINVVSNEDYNKYWKEFLKNYFNN